MKTLLTTVATVALLTATASLATAGDNNGPDFGGNQSQTQGQGQGQSQGQGQTAYGGNGTGVGIAGARSRSSSRSNAAAISANENENYNRNSLTTKQLNEQSLANSSKQANSQKAETGSQDTNVDASSNDDTHIPVGSVISYTYVPNTIPQAVATNEVVVTSWTVHVLDPLFGMSDQHVHLVPTTAVNLGELALDTSTPKGTAAAAYLCAHDGSYAEALAVHCY